MLGVPEARVLSFVQAIKRLVAPSQAPSRFVPGSCGVSPTRCKTFWRPIRIRRREIVRWPLGLDPAQVLRRNKKETECL